jgi:hypothetical protein
MLIPQEREMDTKARMLILVTIIVFTISSLAFYAIKQSPERLTIPFAITVMVTEAVALSTNIWYRIIR